jgi:hypothetical protein
MASPGISIEDTNYGSNIISGCFMESCAEYCIKLNSPGNHIIGNWFHVKDGGDPLFIGSGLNDLSTGTAYSGSGFKNYRVEIDGTGTPNTFKWSDDGGTNYTTGVSCSTSDIALNNGITIKFGATTGHTSGDRWDFVAGMQYMDWGSYPGQVYLGNTEHSFNISDSTNYKERLLSNVGIGCTTPAYPLHLKSNETYDHFVIENGVTNKKWSLASVDGSGLGDVADFFSISDVGGTSRITVQDGTGHVGIGTFSPVTKLCVAGDITAIGPNWSEGNSAVLYLGVGNYHYIKAKYGTGVQIGTYGADEAITLRETTGNVGIGTTDPDYKLSVVDTNASTQAIFGQGRSSGTSQVCIGQGLGASSSLIAGFNHDSEYGFVKVYGTAYGIVLSDSETVGIGTPSPEQKLDVNGNIRTSGRFLFAGSVPGTAVGNSGDVAGMIAVDASYLYVCKGTYDGTTHIWTRTALTSW